ncbi:unnamed protein product [Oikopleura dioica]|uniref:Uncharacterized protein n=1 Tax=Oikopleura dioica TaxID=34765 RepID=E4XRH3_OIKDI|nr:unnamed protein product [Oikopleura dioica]
MVFQERMIICGGGNANAGQTCEMMPPHLKHWERFPPMMTYRSRGPGMAATSWGLLVAGANYPNSRTEILVNRRLGWAEGPELAFKIGTTTMVANDHEAFIVGGYQGTEKFVLRLKSAESDWEEIGSLNRVRYKHASVLVGREIWLFGGHENRTDVVEVFDITTRRSTDLAIFLNSTEGMLHASAALIT